METVRLLLSRNSQGFNQTQKGAVDMMRKETQSRDQEIQQIGSFSRLP